MNSRGSRTEYGRSMALDSSDHIVHDTQGETPSAPLIHIESSDDEVILSSPRSFADAKLNSRKRRRVAVPVVDVDSGNTEDHLPNLAFGCTRRRSALSSEIVINCDQYINLESSSNSVNGNAEKPPEQSTALTLPTLPQEQSMVLPLLTLPQEQFTVLPLPTPPPGIIFSCPMCMNPCIELNCIELMSTLRGHVFCESCIKVMDSSETVIYFDHNINLQSRWNYVNGYSENLLGQSTVLPSPIPPPEQSMVLQMSTPPPEQSTVLPAPTPPTPPEPIFSCPICMNAFVESMSTKCGHVFCKSCITRAITVQKRCPTCRQKLTARGIHRVYLPTTSSN